jgi:putative oxidoreductase
LVRKPRHGPASCIGSRASPELPPGSASSSACPRRSRAIIGVLTVAFITNHHKAGFFVFRRPIEGWEYLMNLIAASFAIGCLGPGRWSLDNAIDFELHGWGGLIVTVVIGIAGALSLLAVFWRPPAPAAP